MGDGERPVPAVRASDAERERAAEVLRRAGGAGRLTVEELDSRLEAVYAAQTRGELDALLEDLPDSARKPAGLPVRPGDEGTRWIVSVMGGSDRSGRWRIGRRCTVVNVMGGNDLELHGAELAADVVELRVFSLMGGSDIWLPEGLNVEVSQLALLGGNTIDVGEPHPDRDGPLVRIRLVSIMGGTDVRRGRRRSRRKRRHHELHG